MFIHTCKIKTNARVASAPAQNSTEKQDNTSTASNTSSNNKSSTPTQNKQAKQKPARVKINKQNKPVKYAKATPNKARYSRTIHAKRLPQTGLNNFILELIGKLFNLFKF